MVVSHYGLKESRLFKFCHRIKLKLNVKVGNLLNYKIRKIKHTILCPCIKIKSVLSIILGNRDTVPQSFTIKKSKILRW